MEQTFEFTETKARIHLRKDPTEICFSFFSDLPRGEVLAFLGRFLRTIREFNQETGRVYPIIPGNTVFLTVRYLQIDDEEGHCHSMGGEGHVLALKGMTRNFPAEIHYGNTKICFNKPKTLVYSLYELINDFYIYRVLDNGDIMEVGINIGPEQEKTQEVENENQTMQIEGEVEEEPFKGKEIFDTNSEFRALQSTNASENAQILQTEIGKIKDQNRELSEQVSTLQTDLEKKDQKITNLEKSVEELKLELSKLSKERKAEKKERQTSRLRRTKSPRSPRAHDNRQRCSDRKDNENKELERDKEKEKQKLEEERKGAERTLKQ